MAEADRLRYYARYLGDQRMSPWERKRLAAQLQVLTNKGPGDRLWRASNSSLTSATYGPVIFTGGITTFWPTYSSGSRKGICKRAIINLPPRSTKSRFASVLFPSWYLGRHPDHKIMQASHTASLALDFGRDVRNLINSPEYQRIFPQVSLE